MITFKQFLQNKAATKRAELADVEAQAKSAEADEQRKKAATATTSALQPDQSQVNRASRASDA